MEISMKDMSLGAAVVVVLAIVGFSITGAPDASAQTTGVTGKVTAPAGDGSYQEVKLTIENYEYKLLPSELQKDVPVRMEVDMDTVQGCLTDIRIPAFGVAQLVKRGDNVIEFTPDEAGTFKIACSMNMGRGTFTVLESDGSVSDYVDDTTVAAGAGSCDADSDGGCGCGG